jgi:hypothetical protein
MASERNRQSQKPHTRKRRTGPPGEEDSRFYVDFHVLRVDAVCDNYQFVVAHRNRVWHVEMGVMLFLPRGDRHRRVVERAAKENLVAANTLQPNQRIVRRHLRIIAIGVGLRKPVQLASGQPVGVSVAQRFKHMCNVRTPMVVRSPGGSKDLQLRCAGGIQNLPCRQKQKSAVKSDGSRSVGRARHRIQPRAIVFEDAHWLTGPTRIDSGRDDASRHASVFRPCPWENRVRRTMLRF